MRNIITIIAALALVAIGYFAAAIIEVLPRKAKPAATEQNQGFFRESNR